MILCSLEFGHQDFTGIHCLHLQNQSDNSQNARKLHKKGDKECLLEPDRWNNNQSSLREAMKL